jgi:hypothetical protein
MPLGQRQAAYASIVNFVEQIGLDYLRRWSTREASHVHHWSDAELLQIERLERRAIAIAAAAGAVSGGLLAVVEIGLFAGPAALDADAWRELLPKWSIFLAAAVLFSGIELIYLYWTLLRIVGRISTIAGLSLERGEIEQIMALGLSRAALELPSPRVPVYGIDPYARVPRWKELAYAVLYRIKVGLTSFVLRVLLRRVVSRASLRFYMPLIGVPLFALWNGVVARWVMGEVRIRVAGPIAVDEFSAWVLAHKGALGAAAQRLMVEAVGEAIIVSQDAHPNFVLLLGRLLEILEVAPEPLRQPDVSLGSVKGLSAAEQEVLLAAATVAVVLEGRLRRRQREFLHRLHKVCGRAFDTRSVLEARREFLRGQGVGLILKSYDYDSTAGDRLAQIGSSL